MNDTREISAQQLENIIGEVFDRAYSMGQHDPIDKPHPMDIAKTLPYTRGPALIVANWFKIGLVERDW